MARRMLSIRAVRGQPPKPPKTAKGFQGIASQPSSPPGSTSPWRRRVDEDSLTIAGDRQPLVFELLGELPRAGAEVEAEALQEPARALSLELDPDPPVVPRHAGCRLPAACGWNVTDAAQPRFTRVTSLSVRSKPGGQGRRPRGKEIWRRTGWQFSSASGGGTRMAGRGCPGWRIRTIASVS